jgi:predicted transcriptional regulator
MIFMGRRDKLRITVEILKVARNGAKKTEIMSTVGMSFSQAVKYLEELETRELLEKRNYGNNGNFVYKTSEKGRKVFKAYDELDSLMKD